MPTARVILAPADLATLLDLPENVEVVGDVEFEITGPPVPEGRARLTYEMDDFSVLSLVGIEPVEGDGDEPQR